MTDRPSGHRLSSARRRRPQDNPILVLSVLVVLALISLIVVLAPEDRRAPDPSVPTASPTAAATPSPTATITATPGLKRQQSGWFEAEVVPSPTPTYAVPTPASRPTRAPKPTPSISQCTTFSWYTSQILSPSAHVKVDIRVHNRCPYDLGPSNLLFEISGWRKGDLVQRVRGAPFETIRRGRSGELAIGLPGSETWYDEIVVTVFD